MADSIQRAASSWEIEHHSCGEIFKPYYMVVLKNKKAGKSVVKATSTDALTVSEYADQLKDDLYKLTDDEFVDKYQLGTIV